MIGVLTLPAMGCVDERHPHSEATSRIIATTGQVRHHRGPGFSEVFYERALALEFPAQGLEFSREVRIPVHYRDARLGRTRANLVVEGVLVEPVDVVRGFPP